MATIKFWQEMRKATSVDGQDKVMIGKNSNGEAMYVDFQYIVNQAGAQTSDYIPINGNTLPTLGTENKFSIVGSGAYTQSGSSDIVVDDNTLAVISWDGNEWSVTSEVDMDAIVGVDTIDPDGDDIPKEKAVADYVEPLFSLTKKSNNLADKREMKRGYYVLSSGFNNSQNWIHYPAYNLNKNTTYTINRDRPVSTGLHRIIFYSPNDEVISAIPGDELTGSLTFTTPSEDFYAIINIGNTVDIGLNPTDNIYANNFRINEGDTLLPYQPFNIVIKHSSIDYDFEGIVHENSISKLRDIQDVFDTTLSDNLVDKETMIRSGQYVYDAGTNTVTLSASLNWINLIPLKAQGGVYALQGVRPNGEAGVDNVRIYFTDLSGTVLQVLTSRDVDNKDKFIFTTPWGASEEGYIAANIANMVGIGENPIDNEYSNAFMINKGAEILPYQKYGENITIDAGSVKNLPRYDNDIDKIIVIKTSATAMTLYYNTGGNASNWIGVGFKKFTNMSRFIDFWRIDTGNHYIRTGEFNFLKVAEIIQTGVWENAIYTTEPEYNNALGSSHGWELMQDIEIKLDGQILNLDSIGSFKCSKFEASQLSHLVTADGNSVRAISNKEWSIKYGDITSSNEIIWQMVTGISDKSFVSMLPVNRKDGDIQITNRAMRDDEWKLYDVSKSGFENTLTDDRHNDASTFVIEGINYNIEMNVEATPILTKRGFWVQNTELYNKLYFQLGETTANPDDVWSIDTKYKILIK